MLTVDLTTSAHMDTSDNHLLKLVHEEVELYNSLLATVPPPAPDELVDLLDRIVMIAADYLTSKKPKSSSVKNVARWVALTDLVHQVGQEAETLGAKQLTTPDDFREIKGDPNLKKQCYWLERLDTKHRPGYQLSEAYEGWLASASTESFWDYANAHSMVDLHYSTKKNQYFPVQVAMLGAVQRANYHISYGTGRWTDSHGHNVRTEKMKTHFSGKGWGIFVCDPTGNLYLGTHKVGRFHHSSFLAGTAVMAAGEMVVENGQILLITTKTGHYRAGVAELKAMLTKLPDPMINKNTIVCPAPYVQTDVLFYKAGDFRAQSTAATPLHKRSPAFGILPDWAKNAGIFNKMPALTAAELLRYP
jgi:hypothetical protein